MPFRDVNPTIEWVDSNARLAQAVASWPDVIAIDTEFVRTSTYFPAPGLYQIGTPDVVYLIDPLAIDHWEPFVSVLQNEQTVKVMHACQEDLELLLHHLNVMPTNIFDTQFAHAFLSSQYSLSYVNLVAHRLELPLSQHATRSNWLARPLSDAQVEYAVEDVLYLIPLFEQLQNELQNRDRWEWFAEDMLQRGRYQLVQPEDYYLQVRKARNLSATQLSVFKALCAWRERRAQDDDVPRNRVIWDDHLLAFARQRHLVFGTVAAALPRVVTKRFGEEIMQVHREASANIEPLPPMPGPLSARQGAVVKLLRQLGLQASESYGLAPELLCRKRDLEACVRAFSASAQLSDPFLGWRKAVVGLPYMDCLQTHLTAAGKS